LHTTEEEKRKKVMQLKGMKRWGGGEGESMLKRMPNICTKEKAERREEQVARR
jgi:hypothetical protein